MSLAHSTFRPQFREAYSSEQETKSSIIPSKQQGFLSRSIVVRSTSQRKRRKNLLLERMYDTFQTSYPLCSRAERGPDRS
jgi:hypothetical protein